jgi:hypothetical protein
MIILQITEMDHELLEEMGIMQDLTFYVKRVPIVGLQVVVLVKKINKISLTLSPPLFV